MEVLKINGGRRLEGVAEVRGSKNVAPKLMIASLLTPDPCVIENIPLSLETEITRELCESIGSEIEIDPNSHTLKIQTKNLMVSRIPEFSRRNRIPILALGPLLHRAGVAEVPVLGGDLIGHRPIDYHLAVLRQMGIHIEELPTSYFAQAGEIKGANVSLPFPSVGATENCLLAAVLAQGKTTITNAAIEPEIMNLIEMLILMGAKIIVNPNLRRMEIEGVASLKGARCKVMPDRTEIVSFVCAAMATGGSVEISDLTESHLESFLKEIKNLGANWEKCNKNFVFSGKKPYRAVKIKTEPHPGFMTDWQQPFSVLLTQADGVSEIHETVYEDRFAYVKDLVNMGADITLYPGCGPVGCRFEGGHFLHRAEIRGPAKLKGGIMEMRDIRAGMAHIIAGLVAQGESKISGVEHIDRGYEKIDERLRKIGADIIREEI